MALVNLQGDDWVMEKGKHEGKNLEEVAEEDPDYIAWLYNDANIKNQDLMEYIEELAEAWMIEL